MIFKLIQASVFPVWPGEGGCFSARIWQISGSLGMPLLIEGLVMILRALQVSWIGRVSANFSAAKVVKVKPWKALRAINKGKEMI